MVPGLILARGLALAVVPALIEPGLKVFLIQILVIAVLTVITRVGCVSIALRTAVTVMVAVLILMPVLVAVARLITITGCLAHRLA